MNPDCKHIQYNNLHFDIFESVIFSAKIGNPSDTFSNDVSVIFPLSVKIIT